MSLRTVEEHLTEILAAVRPIDCAEVALATAAGRTLAQPVRARVDIPVFDNSAMDGFAVRFADVSAASAVVPAILRVVADLPAGSELDPPIAAGEAARIMTGSPLPSAADTVVPFEDTVGGLADSLREVAVRAVPRGAGAHVRRRGGDAHVGDEIVPAGVRLGALQLAAAAAAGVARVSVFRAPRVVVLSTGTELASPGAALRRGQIPESNSVLLAELAREAGADIVHVGSVGDDDADFRDALTARADADVVITSGGVSAGAYEVVKNVLGDVASISFVTVAMQPGRPQGFGILPTGALFFGLPGNPVSSAVSFEAFIRPALLALQGRSALHRPILRLTAAEGWSAPPGRRQYLPAAIDRGGPAPWRVRPATAGGSASHLAGGLARAEAYAIVPAGIERVEAGDGVDVMLVS